MAAYITVCTQWRTGGMGHRVGLDYNAAIRTLELHLPRWQREEADTAQGVFRDITVGDLLEDVALIESAVLVGDDEERERERVKRGD